MTSPVEPYLATLQQIALINDKRAQMEARLRRAQREAESQFLHHVTIDYNAGRITMAEVFTVMDAYRASTDSGFATRWNEVFPENWNRLCGIRRSQRRHAPNGPNGTYTGSFPLPHTEPHPAPGTPVVYVLFDPANVPCYVGSSADFRIRLKAHHRDGKVFATWQAYPCSSRESAYEREVSLLEFHKPYLNRRVGR